MSKEYTMWGVIAFLFLIFSFNFINPAEDAVILYEYSKTFAEIGVVSYGNSGYPIEGATDFLWMLLISLFSFIGIDEFLSSLILTSLSIVYIFKKLNNLKYGLILSLAALLLTPYIYSSAQGFSAIFFSAFYIQCLVYFRNSDYQKMYLGILLLCLVRPDGVIWGMPLVLLHQLCGGLELSKLKTSLIYLIIPGISYFLLRYDYFGQLLPLPFYVKSYGERDFLTFFLNSLQHVFYCAIPFIIYFTVRKDWKSLFIISIPILFFSSMALSQNVGNRFLAPMFFGGLILLKQQTIDRAIIIISSIILSIKITLSTAIGSLETKYENVFSLSQSLYGIDGKMLVTEAGRLTFYSDWLVHDSWGLNTPAFAKKLITPTDISNGNYDLVVSHCNNIHTLLKNETQMTKRTWNNQCLNISLGIRDDFSLYLVPYKVGNSYIYSKLKTTYNYFRGTDNKKIKCQRYDMYSVNNTSENKTEIINKIINHGGIIYSKDLNIINDQVCN